MARPNIFSQDYIKKCFDAWYLGGRPNAPKDIKALIPDTETGKKPSTFTINKWRIQGAWDAWADDLDARAWEESNTSLVNKKAQMLRKHQEQAAQVSAKALDYLLHEGFDSASSAVQAFFKGLEEQRKTAGFSDLLEKLDKMTNNDVEREIIALLNRASENDQVIDTESEDIPELEDGTEDAD